MTTLEVEGWLARKVATLTRQLSLDAVGLVDAAVADAVGSESPARVLELTRAKVIEADPAADAAQVEAEKRRRYATLSRTDEHGLRLLIARVTAGDAAWLDAMLERVADLLAARHAVAAPASQAAPSRDELRSQALGWLARPAELLTLLLESQQEVGPQPTEPQPTEPEPTDAEDEDPQSRATAFPATSSTPSEPSTRPSSARGRPSTSTSTKPPSPATPPASPPGWRAARG